MTRSLLLFLLGTAAAVTIALLLLTTHQQQQEHRRLLHKFMEVKAATRHSTIAMEELRAELAAKEEHVNHLEQARLQADASRNHMEAEMRQALESRDVTISELQGKLTVNILDRILFDSGEALLKTEGREVLMKIAAILEGHPDRLIHVIGHTDNVPIRSGGRGRFATNWELSAARATAAVRFLHEKAGLNPARMAAVGYGEYHPVADNSTAEGRALNRRIAVVILPEVLQPTDVPPPLPDRT
jgi:chemotaxis protein MotB